MARFDRSRVDDFDNHSSIESIAKCCSAVGFNTIPAWLRPYKVLSNGEQFRAQLARTLLEMDELAVMDEFTSVVDRQVAKIGCHAVQKYVRKNKKRFVAVSCHDDIVDWLQPDWVLRPDTQSFDWRSVQPRPQISVSIEPTDRSHWPTFSKFHYLTSSIHRNANFSLLKVNGIPAAIAGWMARPTNKAANAPKTPLVSLMRVVTLPDYQGLGLAFVLMEFIGGVFRKIGINWHTYPAHASLIRSFHRNRNWEMKKGTQMISQTTGEARSNGRPCATFRYIGERQTDENTYKHLSAFGTNRWWCRLPKWKRLMETQDQ